MSDLRLRTLHRWLREHCQIDPKHLKPLGGDASFRRYFRLHGHGALLMDAPPPNECSHTFYSVAERLRGAGLRTPRILEHDAEHGIVLLEDFGDQVLLDVLRQQPERREARLEQALAQLIVLGQAPSEGLPIYDRQRLLDEMHLFQTWFLERHLGLSLSAAQQADLDATLDALCDSALEQPQGVVHRDYHSRNLMCLDREELGILDFQDAVYGPLTYDPVSLLRDCYLELSNVQVSRLLDTHYQRLQQAGLLDAAISAGQFRHWFEQMGLQRHLKVLGIFCRLWYRDGKAAYLADLPLTLKYARAEAIGFDGLQRLLHDIELPPCVP